MQQKTKISKKVFAYLSLFWFMNILQKKNDKGMAKMNDILG